MRVALLRFCYLGLTLKLRSRDVQLQQERNRGSSCLYVDRGLFAFPNFPLLCLVTSTLKHSISANHLTGEYCNNPVYAIVCLQTDRQTDRFCMTDLAKVITTALLTSCIVKVQSLKHKHARVEQTKIVCTLEVPKRFHMRWKRNAATS